MRRQNRELKRANEIVQTASAFFASGLGQNGRKIQVIDAYASRFGIESICTVLSASLPGGFMSARAYYQAKKRSVSLMRGRHEARARDI